MLGEVGPPAGHAMPARPQPGRHGGHGAGGGGREHRVDLQPHPLAQIRHRWIAERTHAHPVDQHQYQVRTVEQVAGNRLGVRGRRRRGARRALHRAHQVDERRRRVRWPAQRTVSDRRCHDFSLPGRWRRPSGHHARPAGRCRARQEAGSTRMRAPVHTKLRISRTAPSVRGNTAYETA